MSTGLRFPTLALIGTTCLAMAACADDGPLDPPTQIAQLDPSVEASMLKQAPRAKYQALVTLAVATARYHNVDAALADGFIPVGECEVDEGESPGGIPYANLDYLTDGIIDPSRPDALLYESGPDGKLRLVGVELAIPYPLWTAAEPPEFFGEQFRREDDMGVFGLHIWLWRHNPEGLFAWGNPRVACEEES